MLFRRSIFFASLALLGSCGQGQKDWEEQSAQQTAQEPIPTTVIAADSWERLYQLYGQLPQEITDCLQEDYYLKLQTLMMPDQSRPLRLQVLSQLVESPDRLPMIPGIAMPLTHFSAFDGHELLSTVQAPEDPEAAKMALIYLGETLPFSSDLSAANIWQLRIPTRAGLNYQLVSEGDFWDILHEIQKLHPSLKNIPTSLVGVGHGADAALALANNYPAEVQGVLFSGGGAGLNLPNLVNFPLVHFNIGYDGTTAPWAGPHFIQKIQTRGSGLAQCTLGGLGDGVNSLLPLMQEAPQEQQFFFNDYCHGHLTPWLCVLSKATEDLPVSLTLTYESDTINIDAPNVTAVELNRRALNQALPKVNKIRLNGMLYGFQMGDESIILGEGANILELTDCKAKVPGSFANFFRSGPVLIVYQDSDASPSFLREAQNLAQKLARLDFVGLPPTDLNLPTLPLSAYKLEEQGPHRLIFIGYESHFKPLLEKTPGYYPISDQGNEFLVADRPIDFLLEEREGRAYSLIYPPEGPSPIRLALGICTDNFLALEAMSRHFTSATALFNPGDFFLWTQRDQDYHLSSEQSFDSYWRVSTSAPKIFSTPRADEEVWEQLILQLMESEHQKFLLPSLVNHSFQLSKSLSYKDLTYFVNNFPLVEITLSDMDGAVLGNRILEALDLDQCRGLDQFLFWDRAANRKYFDPSKFRWGKKLSFVTDARVLAELSQAERSRLSYRMVGHSVFELVMDKLLSNPEALGKQWLHIANQKMKDSGPWQTSMR